MPPPIIIVYHVAFVAHFFAAKTLSLATATNTAGNGLKTASPLASTFAIDIATYAIMSNHYHVVLRINHEPAESWTRSEVIGRWHRIFKSSLLSQRYAQGEILSKAEHKALSEQANKWRERLMSSWFMRCSNEPIARKANHEDKITGRFWEGR
jgi:hypothetical protein